MPEVEVNYTLPYFEFERQHNPDQWRKWASVPTNRLIGIVIAAVYVVLIFVMKALMEKRNPFVLKTVLIVWNLGLAVFSWMGSIRMVPFFLEMISKYGIDGSLCEDAVYRNPVTGFWILAFVFSKIPELFDTVFIVLRKQKLIFLHWYHHASVVVLAFANWYAWPGIGLWQSSMNYSVHALMYSYYMLRAMNVKPPQFVNKTITTLQIIQMIVACTLGGRAFYRIASGEQCGTDTLFTSGFAFFLYFSYLILFVHFFYVTYIAPVKRDLKGKSKDE